MPWTLRPGRQQQYATSQLIFHHDHGRLSGGPLTAPTREERATGTTTRQLRETWQLREMLPLPKRKGSPQTRWVYIPPRLGTHLQLCGALLGAFKDRL